MTANPIVFVTPRYNAGSAGGAEVLCQAFAERLAHNGTAVEVLTTCARDSYTWENHFPEGRHDINGVCVRRFSMSPRDRAAHARLEGLINEGRPLSQAEQEQWLENGVFSATMAGHIAQTKDAARCFILLPYLFGTTFFGARAAGGKAVILPCLHDEAFARLDAFKAMLGAARGALFNSAPEMELAQRLYGLDPGRCAVVGMGIVPSADAPDAARFRKKYGVDGPFILYAGRREGGKNTPLLVEYFKIMKNNCPEDVKLVLAGSGAVPATGRPDIIDLGYIPEQDKHDAMAACAAFCQPSVNESFSIVIMEAWLAGAPALVSARCAVTSDHCRRARAGLYFASCFEFEEAVRFLLSDKAASRTMAESGRNYVLGQYSWEKVLTRFDAALGSFGL